MGELRDHTAVVSLALYVLPDDQTERGIIVALYVFSCTYTFNSPPHHSVGGVLARSCSGRLPKKTTSGIGSHPRMLNGRSLPLGFGGRC